MNKPEESAEYSLEHYPVVEVLAVIGDHWTLCVLNEAFSGVRRFAEMRSRIGIASNVLSNRLARLVKNGVLEQLPYKEAGTRTRYEYQLTRKGLDLLPALVALIQWGDRYLPHADSPEVKMVHAGCNHELQVEIVCTAGHKITQVQELLRTLSPPVSV